MLVRVRPGWAIDESAVTPEHTFRERRKFLRGLAIASTMVSVTGLIAACDTGDEGEQSAAPDAPEISTAGARSVAELLPVMRNAAYVADDSITEKKLVTRYNNFLEFGSHKNIWKTAVNLQTSPWDVTIDGLVEKPISISFDDLVHRMPLEERVYRHRCVEAWSMVVPWSGFPLSELIAMARPLSDAKFLRMESFFDSDIAPGQRQAWYPWPYTEALTIDEATNELAFVVVGAYGKPLPEQNGAPLRLAVPWKYGFKHIKSITRFTLVEDRPQTFWEDVQPNEYGFWANVNPKVRHPRWSQRTEKRLGSKEKIPTLLFNGYADQVAHLYEGIRGERLYT